MAAANEKNGELKRWAELVGHGQKIEDVTICHVCHTKHHPKNRGHADYVVDWALRPGLAISLRVEGKSTIPADPLHFDFNRFEDHQREWLRRWGAITTYHQTWLWLQMGSADVDAVVRDGKRVFPDPNRRQVWLVTFRAFLAVEAAIFKLSGLKNLPKNTEAAQTRVASRELGLHADNLLRRWRLDWQGRSDWWMSPEHPIWRILDTHVVTYEQAAERRHVLARPD